RDRGTRRFQRARGSERAGGLGEAARPQAGARLPGSRGARAGGDVGRRAARACGLRSDRAVHPSGVPAVELTATRYQVGQRLRHPQVGEGLVVEVHTDRGREVLEVVFDGRLRRLSAQREWEVLDAMRPGAAEMADATTEVLPAMNSSEPITRVWHPQTQ